MTWHSFITSPSERKKRARNIEENMSNLKGDIDEKTDLTD